MDWVLCVCVLLTLLVVYCYVGPRAGEGFVSERAVQLNNKLVGLFKNGVVSYKKFKRHIPGADPVKHADAVRLIGENRLTPETVDRYIL